MKVVTLAFSLALTGWFPSPRPEMMLVFLTATAVITNNVDLLHDPALLAYCTRSNLWNVLIIEIQDFNLLYFMEQMNFRKNRPF